MAAQVVAGPQVDLSAEQPGEAQLELRHGEQSGDPIGLELDEQIDVAVGTKVATEGRAERHLPPPRCPDGANTRTAYARSGSVGGTEALGEGRKRL